VNYTYKPRAILSKSSDFKLQMEPFLIHTSEIKLQQTIALSRLIWTDKNAAPVAILIDIFQTIRWYQDQLVCLKRSRDIWVSRLLLLRWNLWRATLRRFSRKTLERICGEEKAFWVKLFCFARVQSVLSILNCFYYVHFSLQSLECRSWVIMNWHYSYCLTYT